MRASALLAVVLAVCGAACGEAPLDLGSREPDAEPDTEARALAPPNVPLDDATLDALPWAARLERERAIAEADPLYAPRMEENRPVLGSGGATARFSPAHTRIEVGGRDATFELVAVGREGYALPLSGRSGLDVDGPQIRGLEVRTQRAPSVVEWWRALPSGLEHGVTLSERPAGEGPLVLTIAVEGQLTVRAESETSVALLDGERVVGRYTELAVLDAAGDVVAARMTASGGTIEIVVQDASARYPLIVDPLVVTLEQVLAPTAPVAGDLVGSGVAFSGDGLRAIVGAPGALGGVGNARIYRRASASWVEEAVIAAPSTEISNGFGQTVAMTMSGNRALIGAPNGQGNAFVFVRSGTTWTMEASFCNASSTPSIEPSLATAVALTSDGSLALIGSPSGGPGGLGAVHVYGRAGAVWTFQRTLLPTSSCTGACGFGGAIDMTPDASRVAVGAASDNSDRGRVRILTRSGASWIEEASFAAPDTDNFWFGRALAMSDDGLRLLIGRGVRFASNDPGEAFVYLRTGTTWAHERSFPSLPGGAQGLALSADGSRAVVAGLGPATQLYLRVGTSWTDEGTLLATDGTRAAITADGTRVLVGTPRAAPSNAGSARVYLVSLAPNGTSCSSDAVCLSGFCTDGVCCNNACGGGLATDCRACSSALTGGANGTCSPLSAALAPTVTCRASGGFCDVAEVCTSSSTACPANVFQPGTLECRASSGAVCDVAEFCTGSSAGCPPDGAAPATTVCRASASLCDGVEYCDGTATTCPADVPSPVGTICRAAAGACDLAEVCDGTSRGCPTNRRVPTGTICRASAGDCDIAEVCDGASAACPGDGFAGPLTTCRPAVGTCDVAETCNGTAVCPADTVRPAAEVCRAAAGTCDVEEICDGTSGLCPVDTFAPTSTPCGSPSGGACDLDDHCAGTSASCIDARRTGEVCRASSSVCDAAEICGSGLDCPPDGFSPPDVICRDAVGDCDAPERCTGLSGSCPPDVLRATGFLCRPAAHGTCDVAETCTGGDPACPADVQTPDGTACAPAPTEVCDAQDVCRGGLCPDALLVDVECRAEGGACDPAERCTGASRTCPTDVVQVRDTVCRASVGSASCDPAEACDGVSGDCPSDVNMCLDTGPAGDATPAPAPAEGCACRAGASPRSPSSALIGIGPLALLLRRRAASARATRNRT